MSSRILTVVGARPQFIKAAVVSHVFAGLEDVNEIIVHTGQHYDFNMSQAFFDELSIPKPKINLNISGGSHAQMTGRMMVALEEVMNKEVPNAVLLYGDTNSTLAAALVSAKLGIPIVHVEAGARTYSRTNPEEINRICVDHISSLLLTCTQRSMENLEKEGLEDNSIFVGDPMYDAFCMYREVSKKPLLRSLDGTTVVMPGTFYYLTCHREENTLENSSLHEILKAVDELGESVIYPVHPRNKETVMKIVEPKTYKNVVFVEPLSYLNSLYLVDNAVQVITDSGGLQREAFFAGTKCITVLDFEVWPETMVDNRNILAKPNKESILSAVTFSQRINTEYEPFGDGSSAVRIVDEVVKLVRSNKK